MRKENIETRSRLKSIGSVKDFQTLLEQAVLSEEERKILWMHYKEQKSLSYIASELGMSESTMTRKHSKALMKIGKLFL